MTEQLSLYISTHAPRTGGDSIEQLDWSTGEHFNPRPPHRGRHPSSFQDVRSILIFQPTPPAQGATRRDKTCIKWQALFQPTPPAQGATVLAASA